MAMNDGKNIQICQDIFLQNKE